MWRGGLDPRRIGLGERRSVSLIVDSAESRSAGITFGEPPGGERFTELEDATPPSCSACSACTTSAKEMNDSRRLSAAAAAPMPAP